MLKEKQHLLGYVASGFDDIWNEPRLTLPNRFMADKIMPLSEAVEGYDIFDKMKAQKVIFEAGK